jgi:hypothetical protein
MRPRPLHIGDDENGQSGFLTPHERTMGVQVIGAPGAGKSQALNYQIAQDERYLPGAVVTVDVAGNHEDSMYAQALARAIRCQSLRPTYFINLSAGRWVHGFNIFSRREGADPSTRVQQCIRRVFTAWDMPDLYEKPRILYWGTGVFAAGFHRGSVGLTELRLLLDHDQAALRTHLTEGSPVESRWRALNQKRLPDFEETVEGIRNRLDALVSAATPRRFLSLVHPPAMLDFREVFARRARVHINAQESDHLDREHANLIVTLLLASFIEEACRRPDYARAPVSLFVDEAHRFVGADLAAAFVEGRKFNIFTTIAHQHIDQLRKGSDERILNDILSCARTKMVFALGSDRDAKALVHDIFVNGINYTEPKYVQVQTKFRPVAIREQSVTRSRGGGKSDSRGTHESANRSVQQTRGTTKTRGHSSSDAEMHTTGGSTGTTRTRGGSHTEGTAHTHNHARSLASGEVRSRSYSRTTATTVSDQDTTAHSDGTTGSHTEGTTAETQSKTTGTSESHGDSHSHSESTTTSETYSEGISESFTESFVEGEADTESAADTASWSESDTTAETESHGTTHTETNSSSSSTSTSGSTGRSRTRGSDRSHTGSRNWSMAVTDQPGRRHEEFREDAPHFYTFEEQVQRLADSLRLPPQRSFVLRRPDCSTQRLSVPFRKPLRYSRRLLARGEDRAAVKTSAVACEEADRIIAERLRQIKAEAAGGDHAKLSAPRRRKSTERFTF